MSANVRDLVVEYVSAAGDKRFDRLEELVHPDATMDGTVKATSHGAQAFVQGFRNLAPIIDRNEIRELIVSREPIRKVKEAARKLGTRFLREAALEVLKSGETTLQEINRVTLVA